jgi:ubiquinone/menaquinone biosynthesis C-methylase UbiE
MIAGFEQTYLALRLKERRMCSDSEVMFLPDITIDNPHYAEWQLRKESSARLIKYFEKKQKRFSLLEVGCGNGWLSHRLSSIAGCEVTGTDINLTELQQAERVFSNIPHLRFVYGCIESENLVAKKFDFIVFAASIQYFSSFSTIITN